MQINRKRHIHIATQCKHRPSCGPDCECVAVCDVQEGIKENTRDLLIKGSVPAGPGRVLSLHPQPYYSSTHTSINPSIPWEVGMGAVTHSDGILILADCFCVLTLISPLAQLPLISALTSHSNLNSLTHTYIKVHTHTCLCEKWWTKFGFLLAGKNIYPEQSVSLLV